MNTYLKSFAFKARAALFSTAMVLSTASFASDLFLIDGRAVYSLDQEGNLQQKSGFEQTKIVFGAHEAIIVYGYHLLGEEDTPAQAYLNFVEPSAPAVAQTVRLPLPGNASYVRPHLIPAEMIAIDSEGQLAAVLMIAFVQGQRKVFLCEVATKAGKVATYDLSYEASELVPESPFRKSIPRDLLYLGDRLLIPSNEDRKVYSLDRASGMLTVVTDFAEQEPLLLNRDARTRAIQPPAPWGFFVRQFFSARGNLIWFNGQSKLRVLMREPGSYQESVAANYQGALRNLQAIGSGEKESLLAASVDDSGAAVSLSLIDPTTLEVTEHLALPSPAWNIVASQRTYAVRYMDITSREVVEVDMATGNFRTLTQVQDETLQRIRILRTF